MGAIEDYLNGLESQDNLDAKEVARKMHELHNEEIITRDATISQLDQEKIALNNTIAEKDRDIEKWQAMNFRLTMESPAPGADKPTVRDENEKPDGSVIKTADLFNEKIRRTNPHFRGIN